jgi:hypothetical protein
MTATVEQLVDAIKTIYHAPVYAEGKREFGISLQMIHAIHTAAQLAGIRPTEEPPVNPEEHEMADLLEVLEGRSIYPKLMGRTMQSWLLELRALEAATRPVTSKTPD